MVSMMRPSRGDRASATTTRYVGCFFLPTRIRRIFTATVVRLSDSLDSLVGVSVELTRGVAPVERDRLADPPAGYPIPGPRLEMSGIARRPRLPFPPLV